MRTITIAAAVAALGRAATAPALKAGTTGKHTSTREMTPTGVWSTADSRLASAARGKAYTDAFVDASVRFIDTWKRIEPLKR